MAAVLSVEDLHVHFGGVRALDGASFTVEDNTITALIGANGAGKTTCLNVLSGFQTPLSGTVTMRGRDITADPPHHRTYFGRTFQIIQTFTGLTAEENVLVALEARHLPSLFLTGVRPRSHITNGANHRKAKEVIERCGLRELADTAVDVLPLGQQRLVELARALALSPDVLLLDEVASGLTEVELQRITRQIIEFRDAGGTVLLIEHNMRFVNQLAQRVVVLDHGRVIFEGEPKQAVCNDDVISAYLGPGWNHD